VLRQVRHNALAASSQVMVVRSLVGHHSALVLPHTHKDVGGHVQQVAVLGLQVGQRLCTAQRPAC
jgi:hypothetical protein